MTVRQVIVTGGSGGIGRAVGRWFVDRGEAVTLTGRNRQTLAAAAEELGAATRHRRVDAAPGR